MSNKDSSLSKEQQKLLKQFKKQISNPHSSKITNQPETKKSQAESEELEDTHLFQQAVAGVKRINNSNIADVKTPRARKVDAQTLAKRAAAEGGDLTELAYWWERIQFADETDRLQLINQLGKEGIDKGPRRRRSYKRKRTAE